jgi:hypothetical protein
VKMAALDEAKQALADCPAYHRIPLHFRNPVSSDTTSDPIGPRPAQEDDREATTHAPEGQLAYSSQNPQQVAVDRDTEPTRREISLGKPIEPAIPRRGPGRPKGSKTKPKSHTLAPVQPGGQRSTRSQTAAQRSESEHTISKKRRVGDPEDFMDEQPDDSVWLRPPGPWPGESSPVISTNAPTIEDPDGDVWYEVSERSDDE